jgi:hypothetical protein
MTRLALATAVVLATLVPAGAVTRAADAREFTITGCLLSNGYAGFQIEDASIDAIDGKAPDAALRSNAPTRWVLEGGGNLRRYTGGKVQVVGRSDWQPGSKDEAPGPPHLEVASIKTVAASCT